MTILTEQTTYQISYIDEIKKTAVFICDDDQYFVLQNDDGTYSAICGAYNYDLNREHRDEYREEDRIAFEVNIIYASPYRDVAIVTALYTATNDAGADESIYEEVRELAKKLKPY